MIRLAITLTAALIAAAARADVPKVVTDIPPVHSLVAQVMGDLGTPDLLVVPGAEAHSFQLRPSQVAALGDADLVFWIGPEMTPWMERALAADFAGKAIGLLDAPGLTVRTFPEVDGGANAGEGHGGTDPHAWLDPGNARIWLDLIAAELAAADPANTAAYEANRNAAKARIAKLDQELTARFAADGPPIVVRHDAYGYLAQHFGLTVAAAIADGDAAEPGAAHLSGIAEIIATQGVRCVFAEAGQDPKRAELLVEGTVARVGGTLDPEGQMLTPGPALYGDLMRALAATITECQAAG